MMENITRTDRVQNYLNALKKTFMLEKKIINVYYENYFFMFSFDKLNSLKFSKLNSGLGTKFKDVSQNKEVFDFFKENKERLEELFKNEL